MVGKMPNVTWPEGSFVETVKGWQSGWFYITEPRDANWAPVLGNVAENKQFPMVSSRSIYEFI